MKKIIIICLLLSCISLHAQKALYVAYQPCDMGLGLRFDYQPKLFGIYNSITYGNYRFDDGKINDHIKISGGLIYDYFTLGMTYHKYGKIIGSYADNTFNPISCEFGMKISINRFCTGLRFDPIKFEGSWDVGFNF